MKAEKMGYGGYIGMKIVLAIAAAVFLAIIMIVVALIVLIPVGGLGAVAVMSGAASGLTWNVYTIAAAVAAGITAFVLLMFVISFVSVPSTLFFSPPTPSIFSRRVTRRWQRL